MKHVLIAGIHSYIGTSAEYWLKQPGFAGMYQIETMDMRGDNWKRKDFSGYDTVLHVAGIAHADIGRVSEEQKQLYYQVNCTLAVETAKKAKAEGVKQFIYLSSIIVYGEVRSVRNKRVITKTTQPSPSNFYGDSKWRAEKELAPLCDETFQVAILRLPMIYGEGCKGNYQLLKKIAVKSPVFPDYPNERSMLYIDNLCEFVRGLIDKGAGGTYLPQNDEYVKTAEMVKQLAQMSGKRIVLVKGFNWVIWMLELFPGKLGGMINKAFGSVVYAKE